MQIKLQYLKGTGHFSLSIDELTLRIKKKKERENTKSSAGFISTSFVKLKSPLSTRGLKACQIPPIKLVAKWRESLLPTISVGFGV